MGLALPIRGGGDGCVLEGLRNLSLKIERTSRMAKFTLDLDVSPLWLVPPNQNVRGREGTEGPAHELEAREAGPYD